MTKEEFQSIIEELEVERDGWKYFATRLIAAAHERERTKVEMYSGLSKDLNHIFRTDI
jgi:hypothetical protein